LTETAVRAWIKQADLDAGTRSDGLTSDERDELAALRRENRRASSNADTGAEAPSGAYCRHDWSSHRKAQVLRRMALQPFFLSFAGRNVPEPGTADPRFQQGRGNTRQQHVPRQ
jgi:hypothetical protein